jgi:hypothetical protein
MPRAVRAGFHHGRVRRQGAVRPSAGRPGPASSGIRAPREQLQAPAGNFGWVVQVPKWGACWAQDFQSWTRVRSHSWVFHPKVLRAKRERRQLARGRRGCFAPDLPSDREEASGWRGLWDRGRGSFYRLYFSQVSVFPSERMVNLFSAAHFAGACRMLRADTCCRESAHGAHDRLVAVP